MRIPTSTFRTAWRMDLEWDQASGTAIWRVPSRPHNGDAAVAQKGALMFAAMNCDGCHGGDASGWVGPSLSDQRWRYGGADSEVFNSIYYGRPKGMPAFGGTLGVDGVWTLVTYIRSLPVPSTVPTESWDDH